jgi:hypothetical protein
MNWIFEGMTFDEIVNDPDIMATMYGSIKEGNALVSIARPGFLPHENGNEDHPADNHHDTNLVAFVAEPSSPYRHHLSLLVPSLLTNS